MDLQAVLRANTRCGSVLGASALWLLLAWIGYARLGLPALSDDGELVAEGASAACLLIGSAIAIGRLRHAIAARGVAMQARGVAILTFAALLIVAIPHLADSYVALSQGLEDERLSGSPVARTIIALGPGGRDVRLSGAIEEGAAQQLATLLGAHPGVERIHLTSEGGLADEGQALGEVIARAGLVTYVADYCVSACTLAFVRGRDRFLMQGARLGFHAPYALGLFGETFQEHGDVQRQAYLAAGVAPDFVTQALAVAPSDIWTPDLARLLAAHVVTAGVSPDRFPDSNLDGIATLDGARNIVLQNFPALEPIARADPGAVARIAAWYLEAYRAGRSEAAVHAVLVDLADRARVARTSTDGGASPPRTLTAARVAPVQTLAEAPLHRP